MFFVCNEWVSNFRPVLFDSLDNAEKYCDELNAKMIDSAFRDYHIVKQ